MGFSELSWGPRCVLWVLVRVWDLSLGFLKYPRVGLLGRRGFGFRGFIVPARLQGQGSEL